MDDDPLLSVRRAAGTTPGNDLDAFAPIALDTTIDEPWGECLRAGERAPALEAL
jgi:hypothetical protein